MSTAIDYDVSTNEISVKDITLFIKAQRNVQWLAHYERMKDYRFMIRVLRNLMFEEYGELSKIEEALNMEKG